MFFLLMCHQRISFVSLQKLITDLSLLTFYRIVQGPLRSDPLRPFLARRRALRIRQRGRHAPSLADDRRQDVRPVEVRRRPRDCRVHERPKPVHEGRGTRQLTREKRENLSRPNMRRKKISRKKKLIVLPPPKLII